MNNPEPLKYILLSQLKVSFDIKLNYQIGSN